MIKEVSVYFINKIKDYQLKIFAEEDEDYPNGKNISIYERVIERALDKAGIFDEEARRELYDTISWISNDNIKRLERHGWKILYK